MSTLTPEKASKILTDVPDDNHFRLHMGTNIKSLKELAEALDIMADRTFQHHVGVGKNDFGEWIEDSIGDEDLAQKIKKMDSKKAMLKAIKSRVSYLEAKPGEHHMCKHTYMKCGVNDFAVGALVGFIIGAVIAAVL